MSLKRTAIAGLLVQGFCTTAFASEGGGGLMSVNFATFFWTALTFVLMVAILGKFAWKPMLAGLNNRTEHD